MEPAFGGFGASWLGMVCSSSIILLTVMDEIIGVRDITFNWPFGHQCAPASKEVICDSGQLPLSISFSHIFFELGQGFFLAWTLSRRYHQFEGRSPFLLYLASLLCYTIHSRFNAEMFCRWVTIHDRVLDLTSQPDNNDVLYLCFGILQLSCHMATNLASHSLPLQPGQYLLSFCIPQKENTRTFKISIVVGCE